MILTPAEPKPPEKLIRVLARKVREQLTKEWEDKKLPSGVHEQWDSIDMAERIYELTLNAVWDCSEYDPSDGSIIEQMKRLVDEGWKPE